MQYQLEPEKAVLSFQVRDSADFTFGKSEKPVRKEKQPNEIFGYNRLIGTDRAYKMSFDSEASIREYDASVDWCRWERNSEFGKLLEQIEFKPVHWTYQPDFNCAFYTPKVR